MRTTTIIFFACSALIASGSVFAGSGSWSLQRPAVQAKAADAGQSPADTAQPQAVKGATGPEGTAGPDGKPPAPTRTTAMHR